MDSNFHPYQIEDIKKNDMWDVCLRIVDRWARPPHCDKFFGCVGPFENLILGPAMGGGGRSPDGVQRAANMIVNYIHFLTVAEINKNV